MNDKASMQSYQDLKVWQEAMNLAEECYRVTKHFPKEETYGMISQIRRASVSIPANIAEGYGRRTRGEYIQFLYIAQGSLKELETHLLPNPVGAGVGCRVWGVGEEKNNNPHRQKSRFLLDAYVGIRLNPLPTPSLSPTPYTLHPVQCQFASS